MFLIKLFKNKNKTIHTVFVSSHSNRIAGRSVSHARAGQYPNSILGPSFQFVQDKFGGI